MDNLKSRFEDFLCTKNDAIDNACFDMCIAIVRKTQDEPAEKAAAEFLVELIFGDKEPTAEVVAAVLISAKKTLSSKHIWTENNGLIDGALEWNMEFIGEITDDAEAILLEAGFQTCHPYYGGDDGSIICPLCGDCLNQCHLKPRKEKESWRT